MMGSLAVVQCKYQKQTVVGSPALQKFLGTIHHTHSHKGFFVTTSTFSLSAEKFAAEHPIELIDGPRLVELVSTALGPESPPRNRARLVLTARLQSVGSSFSSNDVLTDLVLLRERSGMRLA